MKYLFFIQLFLYLSSNVFAQGNITLKLNHEWNGTPFSYDQKYYDNSGRTLQITRVQYYLSGFEIQDNGQSIPLKDHYVLASANISNYNLNSLTIDKLQGLKFDVGVDVEKNHLNPAIYDESHPLALKNPSMHWGWAAGYRFLVIEGSIDDDKDGLLDKKFEFHVTANDEYLTPVNKIETTGKINGKDTEIELYVNIADWLKDIDLAEAGYNHGVYWLNETIMFNTNKFKVFDTEATASLRKHPQQGSGHVVFDYGLPYAPTIFYEFPYENRVNLKVIDMQGKILKFENDLSNAGNYFINMELPQGTYLAVFESDKAFLVSKKFMVKK